MFSTLRTKLWLGLTPLLILSIGLGLWAVVMFSRLGNNIDVILRENYRSVLAAQNMKEALERMDSAALFAIAGHGVEARAQYSAYRPMFEKSLALELSNITLPNEAAPAHRIEEFFKQYVTLSDRFHEQDLGDRERRELYFESMLTLFNKIKHEADVVLEMNQKNMEEENDRARRAATGSIRLMIIALITAGGLSVLIALGLSWSIIGPIRSATLAARGMARGDYDQVIPATTRDELGELASAFNLMAKRIREYQATGTARLVRARKTAQATIDSFPDPVVVLGPEGAVELANPAARDLLGVTPSENDAIPWNSPAILKTPINDVLSGRPDYLPTGVENAICLRENGQERFHLPRVLAIHEGTETLGAAVVLHDVTKFRLVDQLKSDMVSTVSHELKTPLTSIQMAVHLLLEEAVGPLTPKQTELLLAAREDSDRLLAIVNDLLDLTRIEQGRMKMQVDPVEPDALMTGAVERNAAAAEDAGIELKVDTDPLLPKVLVDEERTMHVFDNLIGNAIEHTNRGGTVSLSAEACPEGIRFRIADTGDGIPPEHLPHLFEKFYRVPGSRRKQGAGLGLAIVREIVQAQGGRIDVASELGRGTIFSFVFPTVSVESAFPEEGRSLA